MSLHFFFSTLGGDAKARGGLNARKLVIETVLINRLSAPEFVGPMQDRWTKIFKFECRNITDAAQVWCAL